MSKQADDAQLAQPAPQPHQAPSISDNDEVLSELPQGLWPGDVGQLNFDSRRALLALMKGPYIRADKHRELWAALLADETIIRSRLADVFLELVLDLDLGLAFAKNVSVPESGMPKVMRSLPLKFIDTALLLFLRSSLLSAVDQNEPVMVDREEINSHLMLYQAADSTDESGFEKRINSAVSKMVDNSILIKTDTPDRFLVSPVLSLVFGPDQVAAISAQYNSLLSQEG
ncbi:hypothetical protein BK816_08505 [Boudabousia tangfeifanii]|uniref:DUF4194 domain-containing protein n=1 Tax=Boudabousia tangfeifanii TaxID=1912795 RepID=A0A1D9MMU3_9ACTO|nr:hypothetical protein BK816_08505 [Boudabousia tangfeifanii]